jgi:hypothetical protein
MTELSAALASVTDVILAAAGSALSSRSRQASGDALVSRRMSGSTA